MKDLKFLTPEQAAQVFKISHKTLAKWRCTGENNLPFTKIGGRILYRLADLEAYVDKHSHNVEKG